MGVSDAAVVVSKQRIIDLAQRDRKRETVRESATSSVSFSVYVDGRYSTHATSDIRPNALNEFVENSVAMTRVLEPDVHRKLPEPSLYKGRSTRDLEKYDASHESMNTERRQEMVAAVEEAALAQEGPLISVKAEYSDRYTEFVQVQTNGFEDGDRGTLFSIGAIATADDQGKRPEDWYFSSVRHLHSLPSLPELGQRAVDRAFRRCGQKTMASGSMKVVVENRVASRLLGSLVGGLQGSLIHQKRTFLADRLGKTIGSELLTLVDDPEIPRGLGSSRFDSEGVTRKKRSVISSGVLQTFLVDVYYGSKLGMTPNCASLSNVIIPPGEQGLEEILRDVGQGVYVTGFLGGNSDSTTGDFSYGILGFEIVDGALGAPVGEMNMTGSHQDLWHKLVDVGNDPYPYSSRMLPTLVFDNVSISGA